MPIQGYNLEVHDVIKYAKQKHLGCKEVQANQKQHYKQAGLTKSLISAEAKKLLYQIFVTP